MQITKPKHHAILMATGMVLASGIAHAQQLPTTTPVVTGGEQDQRTRQQQQAREREQTVNAPAVRSSLAPSPGFPALPAETPCFRLDSIVVEVPAALPTEVRAQGPSALPLDPFAFAREW